MKRALGWIALLVVLAPNAARAQEPQIGEGAPAVDVPAEPESPERAPIVTIQIGAKGGPMGSLLGEPDEDVINLPVPSFFGMGGGGGLSVEALWADLVGLEVDVLFASASGTGEIRFPFGIDVDEDLKSTEIQLALLAKLQLGYALGRPRTPESELHAKPYFGIGPTFVFQTSSEFSLGQNAVPIDTAIDPESYTMLTIALGVAIDARPVRIPIELRGQWQPLDHDPYERVDFAPQTGGTLTQLAVRSTWEAQFSLLVGVQYNLEID